MLGQVGTANSAASLQYCCIAGQVQRCSANTAALVLFLSISLTTQQRLVQGEADETLCSDKAGQRQPAAADQKLHFVGSINKQVPQTFTQSDSCLGLIFAHDCHCFEAVSSGPLALILRYYMNEFICICKIEPHRRSVHHLPAALARS